MLRSSKDEQATAFALHLIPRFKHVPPDDAAEIRNILARCSKSQSMLLRIGASYALRQIGGPWAVEQLRNAVAVEPDAITRRILAADLAFIEGRQ